MSSPPDAPPLALLPLDLPRPKRSRAAVQGSVAPEHPVAVVAVDSPLAHLDRPFEYLVPASLHDDAQPGVRVRVRLAGTPTDGFLLERRTEPEHGGPLQPLQRVVSPERVLTPHLAATCRAVADHYGGTMSDVLRLAVPPRHARAEQPQHPVAAPSPEARAGRPDGAAWTPYPAGRHLLDRLARGESPSAAWTALPDGGSARGWPAALAQAAAATLAAGRGTVLVLPDHRDVDRVLAALVEEVPAHAVARVTADQGPEARYRAWLSLLRGLARIAVGTRSAAFAPVPDPGLLAWWDDGDDQHEEPRAPYPHVREVLRARARLCGAALLAGGLARSAEVQAWVEEGLLREASAAPATVRARAPRVVVAGEGTAQDSDPAAASARLPSLAWRTAQQALGTGPVLVQVPRRGYLASLRCDACREPVRCAGCGGPLAVSAQGRSPACLWCTAPRPDAACPACGSARVRHAVVGERRTAEELGRAFPGVTVRTSSAGQVLAQVPGTPALVVATPGAEPVAQGGYAAALLLDGWALLDRAGLDTQLETLRRWVAAAALCRPAGAGGAVVVTGVAAHGGVPAVEALVRWAPSRLAAAELTDRRALGLPPVGRLARVQGDRGAVARALDRMDLPATATELGRSDGPDETLSVVLLARGGQRCLLPRAVAAARAARSVRKEPGDLRIRLDPAV